MNTGKLPHVFCQQDLHCPLRRPWRVFQSEEQASKSQKKMMGFKGGSVQILLGNLYLLTPGICVQCPKICRISKRIDTLVPVWYQVRVSDRRCVQVVVVDAKAKSFVIVGNEENKWGPLRLHRFYTVHCKHFIHLLLLKISHLWPCAERGWGNWSVHRLVEFDSVLHRLIRSEVSVPHASELCKCANEFVPICGMLV